MVESVVHAVVRGMVQGCARHTVARGGSDDVSEKVVFKLTGAAQIRSAGGLA